MSEEVNIEATATVETPVEPEVQEELSYHAVQKDGTITAIWEMRGRKHIRTIDPRSDEGRHLLGPHEQDSNPDGAH